MNLAGKKGGVRGDLARGVEPFSGRTLDLMNELAYFWAEEGHHLPEALALEPPRRAPSSPITARSWTPAAGFTSGWTSQKMHYRTCNARSVLTNNDPVVLQHVGDTYSKLGLRREAIASWTRALQKDPHNGDLASRIDAAKAQANNAHLRSRAQTLIPPRFFTCFVLVFWLGMLCWTGPVSAFHFHDYRTEARASTPPDCDPGPRRGIGRCRHRPGPLRPQPQRAPSAGQHDQADDRVDRLREARRIQGQRAP